MSAAGHTGAKTAAAALWADTLNLARHDVAQNFGSRHAGHIRHKTHLPPIRLYNIMADHCFCRVIAAFDQDIRA